MIREFRGQKTKNITQPQRVTQPQRATQPQSGQNVRLELAVVP